MQDYYIPSLPSNETYPFAIYIDAKEYSAATGSKLIFNMSSQRFVKSIDGDYKYLYNSVSQSTLDIQAKWLQMAVEGLPKSDGLNQKNGWFGSGSVVEYDEAYYAEQRRQLAEAVQQHYNQKKAILPEILKKVKTEKFIVSESTYSEYEVEFYGISRKDSYRYYSDRNEYCIHWCLIMGRSSCYKSKEEALTELYIELTKY